MKLEDGPINGRIYSQTSNQHGIICTQHPDDDGLRDSRRGTTSFAELRAPTGFFASCPDEMPELTEVVGTIDTPVLVVHGERDTFVGIDNSRRLADAFPNSEFHVIPEAGHHAWKDNREPYLAHVLRWIDHAEANS